MDAPDEAAEPHNSGMQSAGDGDPSSAVMPPPPALPSSGGASYHEPAFASADVVSELQRVYDAMTGTEKDCNEYSYDTSSLPQHDSRAYGISPPPVHQLPPPIDFPLAPSSEVEESISRSDEVVTSTTTRRGKRAATPPDDSSTRKKKKETGGKWSKRFIWPEDLHRDFVSAIFDVGLKNASPNVILEFMAPHPDTTAERIKSHLQKYRLHRERSKKQFLHQYDSRLAQLQQGDDTKPLAGGDAAGQVAYATMNDADAPPEAERERPGVSSSGESLLLPELTEAERKSPIGASMGYLLGLFHTLCQQLMTQRAMAARLEASQVAEISHQVAASSSSRTTLVESNKMKREMRSQMVFQNKMRQLKQQEVNKYSHQNSSGTDQQASGEDPQRPRGLSVALESGDLNWDFDGEEDQLFEFLLNE